MKICEWYEAKIIDTSPKNPELVAASTRIERAQAMIAKIKASIGSAILGQNNVVDLCLATLFAGGHALLIGMPGLAKTKLVEAIAISCGMDWRRIQFTPDLMPSDILGSEVLDSDKAGSRSFRFIKGPIFSQILMADEINRASPRTQSALLQAMQENHVSINGINYDLPKPFHVLATQNPIEHEGAYPLPEAQLDRFLLQIDVPYPDEDTEREILLKTTTNEALTAAQGATPSEVQELQTLVRDLPISERFLEVVLGLVRELRPETTSIANVKKSVIWGPGPRGGQSIIMAAKARALIKGKLSPTIDDIGFVAVSALQHRMALNWNASENGINCGKLIGEALDKLQA